MTLKCVDSLGLKLLYYDHCETKRISISNAQPPCHGGFFYRLRHSEKRIPSERGKKGVLR